MALTYGGTLASTIPTVLVTAGPTYATNVDSVLAEIRDCLQAKVTPAGINMNAVLPFAGYAPTGMGYALFNNAASAASLPAATYPRGLYAVGSELYWNSATQQVQITSAGTVNVGSVGSITGDFGGANPARVAFNDAGGRYDFTEDTDLYAKMRSADLLVGEYAASAPFFITIKSPAGLAAAYSLTLPAALPGATSLLQITSAGVISGTVTPSGLTTIGVTGLATLGSISTGAITATTVAGTAVSGSTSVSTVEAGIRHGTRVVNISLAAGMCDEDNTSGVMLSTFIPGAATTAAHWAIQTASTSLTFPLNGLCTGETVTAVHMKVTDTAGGVAADKVTMQVWSVDTSGVRTQVGTDHVSAGNGTQQTLSETVDHTSADEAIEVVLTWGTVAGQTCDSLWFTSTRP